MILACQQSPAANKKEGHVFNKKEEKSKNEEPVLNRGLGRDGHGRPHSRGVTAARERGQPRVGLAGEGESRMWALPQEQW